MAIQITGKASRNGEKIWYTFEWGKGPDERKAAHIFTYAKPKDLTQKQHNKEATDLLSVKKSQMTIDQQALGTPYIPRYRLKDNFIDYFEEFVEGNQRPGNRHLKGSLNQFRLFARKTRVSPFEITENYCQRFRAFLLDRFTGKTPADYYRSFKRVVKNATKDGYFRISPAEDTLAKRNPSKKEKEFLEAFEYLKLIQSPMPNYEIRDAFIFSCYTGLRCCDIQELVWDQINGDQLTTRIIQAKTGKPVVLTLHPIARRILDARRAQLRKNGSGSKPKNDKPVKVFSLPTRNGTNKAIRKWVKRAGIKKYITFSCARLSFSILLQDANVDTATVALLLGHTTTRYVNETYKRHRPKDQTESISRLPAADWYPTSAN